MRVDGVRSDERRPGLNAAQRRVFGFRHLAWLVLGIALLRGLLIVASDPMLAIANNYDQIRVQACLGAYPDRDSSIPPAASSPQAPYARFRFMPEVDVPCFLTSELLFAWAAWPAMQVEQRLRADHSFSVRWKGGLQFVAWLGLAVLCTRRLIGLNRPDLALGHAVLCAAVVADPGNILYLNTFYGEASAILFTYALLAGIVIALAGQTGQALLAGIALAAFLLAMSKIQHLVVPLLIWLAVACAGIAARKQPGALLVALAIGALLGVVAQGTHMGSIGNESIRSANRVDTLFTAMLPNASKPASLLAELGLPQQCIEQSGKSWYAPGMASRQLCPQVFTLQHRDLLLAAIRDPAMAFRALYGGVEYANQWIPANLGVVEGEPDAGLPWWAPSWDSLIPSLGRTAYFSMLAVLPVLALVLLFRRRRRDQLAANAILLSLSSLPAIVYATSVFGDGYVDLPKHTQLGTACLLAALAVIVCLAVARIVLTGTLDADR
ncbi:MAG: hypothetical protein WAS23_00020 [Dokdonella sp.]|uniref:glycan biosynthesis hexose transferase WsfD n=1 Tax=Dokdonella sp. TaxID=2291710 RepID=UPI003BAFA32A